MLLSDLTVGFENNLHKKVTGYLFGQTENHFQVVHRELCCSVISAKDGRQRFEFSPIKIVF